MLFADLSLQENTYNPIDLEHMGLAKIKHWDLQKMSFCAIG